MFVSFAVRGRGRRRSMPGPRRFGAALCQRPGVGVRRGQHRPDGRGGGCGSGAGRRGDRRHSAIAGGQGVGSRGADATAHRGDDAPAQGVDGRFERCFRGVPGGYGTADELFEILTWAQLGIHEKPVGLLNVSGFFDPLLAWIDHAVEEGFIKEKHRELLKKAATIETLLDAIVRHQPSAEVSKWADPGDR